MKKFRELLVMEDIKMVGIGLLLIFAITLMIYIIPIHIDPEEHHREEYPIYNVSTSGNYYTYYIKSKNDNYVFTEICVSTTNIFIRFEDDVEPYIIEVYTIDKAADFKKPWLAETIIVVPNDVIKN